MPCDDVDAIGVHLSRLRLVRPRQWGACWLALSLWQQLDLDSFWPPRLPAWREGTPWLKVLKTLVAYRPIDPGSEWRLHPTPAVLRTGVSLHVRVRHALAPSASKRKPGRSQPPAPASSGVLVTTAPVVRSSQATPARRRGQAWVAAFRSAADRLISPADRVQTSGATSPSPSSSTTESCTFACTIRSRTRPVAVPARCCRARPAVRRAVQVWPPAAHVEHRDVKHPAFGIDARHHAGDGLLRCRSPRPRRAGQPSHRPWACTRSSCCLSVLAELGGGDGRDGGWVQFLP
jgi:hypothetical protein